MTLLLRMVEHQGRLIDVRIEEGRVVGMRPSSPLSRRGAHEIVDGRGGALLPGLHDHHVHLLATAAARASVDCGSAAGLAGLSEAAGKPAQWIRGVGYHESVAGPLDRYGLDRIVSHQPVRVQHRSGALWMLNTRALEIVASVLDDSDDVERDAAGRPNGRLWRYDTRLRPALPSSPPDLRPLFRELTSYGITSVTDATPDLDATAVSVLGGLGLDVTMLGSPTGRAPRKLLLRDHDLPDWDDLSRTIAETHAQGRPVAVHCVTQESLLLTLAVLDEVGRHPRDRIEHAAVVPDPSRLRGLRVVTQPGFIAWRGDDYLRDVDVRDLPHMYPFASLLAAGVDTVASSDAPYGPLDPWEVLRSARDRLTPSGKELNPDERVPVEVALAGYLTDADGEPRRLEVGARADLCLLHRPLSAALASPDSSLVRATWVAGELTDESGEVPPRR